MKSTVLNGVWKLSGKKEAGGPVRIFSDGEIDIESTVPGNIELDLFHAGIIDDPYIRLNAGALRKYEFYEWYFTRDFEYELGPGNVELVCDGLDCYAAIFINGQLAGSSENALIAHRFDATPLLVNGKNTISIHFSSANNTFRKYPYLASALSLTSFNYESIRVRKPAHVWGWDIAPRMALGGIFRDIRLEEAEFSIEGFLQIERLFDTPARFIYTYRLESCEYDFEDLKITLDGVCEDSVFHAESAVWSAQGFLRFAMDEPKLWFPRGYGKPNLYQVSVKLLRSSTGEVLAEKKFEAGFRDVKLKALPVATDLPEPDFQVVINNVPVRVLGFNHVPSDALHSRDMERQGKILDSACDLNCNMIRIWGGGIYENNSFYEECDRCGIMVWQDFMMACSRYPNDRDFCKVLEKEAESTVKRLRQHPAIVLWTGDNECDCTTHHSIPRNPNENILSRKILPEVCRLHDGSRPYLQSTPRCSEESVVQAERLYDFPLFQVPEQHLWGGMYFKDDYYSKSPASFFSEIGYFGCPAISSIQRFISPENVRNFDSDEWKYHASNAYLGVNDGWSKRISAMQRQVSYLFSEVPEKLEDFVLASQITQAEALKYFIEFIRSSAKRSGILWWNLTDCWPEFSDSVMDYYFEKKLAYRYIKQSQEPLLILLTEEDGMLKTVISNYSNRGFSGEYRVLDIETGNVFDSAEFQISGNETLFPGYWKYDGSEQTMFLIEWTLEDGSKHYNHYLYGKPHFDLQIYQNWLKNLFFA